MTSSLKKYYVGLIMVHSLLSLNMLMIIKCNSLCNSLKNYLTLVRSHVRFFKKVKLLIEKDMEHGYLIIPDSGPLITFAKSNNLDLLCKLNNYTLLVTDAIFYETTWNKAHADSNIISDFLLKNAAFIFTDAGLVLMNNLRHGYTPRLRDLGDRSILQCLQELDAHDTFWFKSSTIVLFEDLDIMKKVKALAEQYNRQARFISTPAYLHLLESANLIPSAQNILDSVKMSNMIINENNIVDELTLGIKQKG